MFQIIFMNNIIKLEKMIKEIDKKENYLNSYLEISECTINKIINIIKSGRLPEDPIVMKILEKLEEGGLL
jgi:hypothetical protein